MLYNSSIYKTSSTIHTQLKPGGKKQKKEAKFLEFLSRAPLVLMKEMTHDFKNGHYCNMIRWFKLDV